MRVTTKPTVVEGINLFLQNKICKRQFYFLQQQQIMKLHIGEEHSASIFRITLACAHNILLFLKLDAFKRTSSATCSSVSNQCVLLLFQQEEFIYKETKTFTCLSIQP